MTDYKFCDLHPSEEGRRQPKENFQTLRLETWQKIDGKNKLFEVKLDGCTKCITSQITDRAVGLGIEIGKMWKTEVWQTGQSGKKFKQMMSADEYIQYIKEEERKQEMEELKQLRATVK